MNIKKKNWLKHRKVFIRPFDKSLIGKKFVFSDFYDGLIVGTIIAVTNDRVIWIDSRNKENWTWRSPNGQDASFDISCDGRQEKFSKALRLEKAFANLLTAHKKLQKDFAEIKKYKIIMDKFNELEQT